VPSVSKKQHNLMAMVANDPAAAKRMNIPQSVGEEFMKADKGKKFGSGGTETRADLQNINNPKVHRGKMALFSKGGDMGKKMFGGKETYAEELKEAKAIKSGKISPQQYAREEGKEESGMKMKKMAGGGMTKMGAVKTAAPSRDGVASKGKTKGTMVKMAGGGKAGMKKMNYGGKC
jgi:hypothetical protein